MMIEGVLEMVWVAANRSVRGDGPPDAYLIGTGEDQNARYVGDTAEIVIQIVRGMAEAAPALPTAGGEHRENLRWKLAAGRARRSS
jgi:hypothetical protein